MLAARRTAVRLTQTISLIALVALAGPAAANEAQYRVQSAAEGQTPPVTRVRIVAGSSERVGAVLYRWWEMTLVKPDGCALGVKALSERVPMTSAKGVGQIVRYMYLPHGGQCLDYRDALSDSALLPELAIFRAEFLPRPYTAAAWRDGFANSGRLLGHALARSNMRGDFPRLDFSRRKILRIRSDLLIGAQADQRDDYDLSVPAEKREMRPLNEQEFAEMIAAGANYFHPTPDAASWLAEQPVFYSWLGVFPDDFYRSNFAPGRMFIDEPGIRFGWDSHVPGSLISPEVFANAITMRVAEAERLANRAFTAAGSEAAGAMPAYCNPFPSWETFVWTAHAQLAGGAAGLVYEGRFVRRGYGWAPEMLLGGGLEGLSDRQQYDHFDSFLRGAARRFGGWWGTSVYPEGDRAMMVPALTRAYDQGARALWFWGDTNLPYLWRLEVLKGLSQHIRGHPRRPHAQADTAIVLPAGFIPNENGIFGMQRDELTPQGASYGDIAAAAMFEGILLSRAGVEYDTTFDDGMAEKPGYRRLIYIRPDGTLDFRPARNDKRAPSGLSLRVTPVADGGPSGAGAQQTLAEARPGLAPLTGKAAAGRPDEAAPVRLPLIQSAHADCSFDEWPSSAWIELQGEPYIFGDNYTLEISLKVPDSAKPDDPQDYLGFTWDQITPAYRAKYRLEGYTADEVVVTSLRPGSAADAAGLREGDVILFFNEKNIRWAFEVWGRVADHKKLPGRSIRLKVRRGGLDRYRGPSDLSARAAMAWEGGALLVAADVSDDVHAQTMRGVDFWKNDCVQIGLDPAFARSGDYGENGHEISFALTPDGPVAFRSHGRRGQPAGVMKDVKVAIQRRGGRTLYEASIPFSELAPMHPALWPRIGMNLVVNDSDDGRERRQRLELRTGAMTAGKKLDQFAAFDFEQAARSGFGAAIFWKKRCIGPGGGAELAVKLTAPAKQTARVRAELASLDDPGTPAARAETAVEAGPVPRTFALRATTGSPPGRYRLSIEVITKDGQLAARDSLPVYIYR
jgi:hypothetical protein